MILLDVESECLTELQKICFHSCIQVARLVKLAVLCAAPLAYDYCLLTSTTVSDRKALDVKAFWDWFSVQAISRLWHIMV